MLNFANAADLLIGMRSNGEFIELFILFKIKGDHLWHPYFLNGFTLKITHFPCP